MRFEPDEEAVKTLGNDRHVIGYIREVASMVRATAYGLGPKRTGHYTRSIKVVIRRKRPGVEVYVVADDFKAHWIEWGAGPSPYRGWRPFRARHVLARSVRLHRLAFKEAKKEQP